MMLSRMAFKLFVIGDEYMTLVGEAMRKLYPDNEHENSGSSTFGLSDFHPLWICGAGAALRFVKDALVAIKPELGPESILVLQVGARDLVEEDTLTGKKILAMLLGSLYIP